MNQNLSSVVCVVVSSLIVDIVGRRPILLVLVIWTGVCNTTVELYFFLEHFEIVVTGMANVTVTIIGDIFPKHSTSIAGPAFTITGGAFSFVASDDLGIDHTCWYMMFTYLFVPFVWFLKRKRLSEFRLLALTSYFVINSNDKNDNDKFWRGGWFWRIFDYFNATHFAKLSNTYRPHTDIVLILKFKKFLV